MHERDRETEAPQGLLDAWLDRLRGLVEELADALAPQPVPVPVPVHPGRRGRDRQ